MQEELGDGLLKGRLQLGGLYSILTEEQELCREVTRQRERVELWEGKHVGGAGGGSLSVRTHLGTNFPSSRP